MMVFGHMGLPRRLPEVSYAILFCQNSPCYLIFVILLCKCDTLERMLLSELRRRRIHVLLHSGTSFPELIDGDGDLNPPTGSLRKFPTIGCWRV